MFGLDVQLILVDAAMAVVEFAVNWLLQSSLLLAAGLALGIVARQHGSAVQSAVYRTTLVAVLICPLATWSLSQVGVSGWSVKLPRNGKHAPTAQSVVAEHPEHTSDTTKTEQQLISAQPTGRFPQAASEKPSALAHDEVRTKNASANVAGQPLDEIVETVPAVFATNFVGFIAWSLASVWLIVTCVFSLRLAIAWRQLNHIRKGGVRAEEATLHLCRQLASALRVIPPEILRSPCLPSPCLAGLRRPVILLPEDDEGLSIREVLLHELAHLKRHDCHWNLLRQITTAVFFFQPLLWKLSRLLETTAEEVCDDYVVEFGGNRQEYAHRLVDIAELTSAPIAAAGVGIVSLRSMLARRVTRIMDTSRALSTRVGNLLLMAVLVGGLVGTLITGFVGLAPRASQAEVGEDASASVAAAKSKSPKDEDLITVRGMVVDSDGRPVSAAEVSGFSKGKAASEATSDVEGRFELRLPYNRNAGMSIMARGPKGLLGYILLPDSLESGVIEQRIELGQPRELKVTVVDAEGLPASAVELVAIADFSAICRATTDEKGRATVHIPTNAPLQFVLAQGATGVDYVLFRRRDEPKNDPYKLASDYEGPVKLTLSPTRTVLVRVIDGNKQPIVGADVYPWYIKLPKHGVQGDIVNLGGLWKEQTNHDGVARFDSIPINNDGMITFWARKDGSTSERLYYDPQKPELALIATLSPLVQVRGHVLQASGKPAVGATVVAAGSGYTFDNYRGTTKTDRNGNYLLEVDPNQYYLFTARQNSSAAPIVSCVVLSKSPKVIELHLQPATRVFGQVTTGTEKSPAAGQYVSLYRHNGDTYYQLPENERLPKENDSHNAVVPRIVQGIQTDSEGRFEFITGPGSHYLFGAENQDATKFEVTGQSELEFNFYIPYLAEGTISGRVVLTSNPEQGVPEAIVFGYPDNLYGNHLRATTNAEGYFEDRRSGVGQSVGVFSQDGRLGAIQHVEPDAENILLALTPTATLRGTLIDEKTGQPAAEREIGASIRIDFKDGTSTPAFQKSDTTDSSGHFDISGVVPGQSYELSVVTERNHEGQARGWQEVGSAKPQDASVLDLGELRLPVPYRPPTLEGQIARRYASGDVHQRLSRILADAKLSYQQMLLIVGDQGSDPVKQFFAASLDYDAANLDLRRTLTNYIQLGVTLKQYEAVLGKAVESLCVLDSSGQIAAQTSFEVLMAEGKLDRQTLEKFLLDHAQQDELPDAEQGYLSALKEAEEQNKSVFVQVSGPGCPPCVLLSRFLEAQKELFARGITSTSSWTHACRGQRNSLPS